MGVEAMTVIRRTLVWVVASDPGLTRLESALSAAFAMGGALGVEYGFARLNHLQGPAASPNGASDAGCGEEFPRRSMKCRAP